ncbi:MAG: hypothetical protein ACRD88_16670 [Terriglobia bacterium]
MVAFGAGVSPGSRVAQKHLAFVREISAQHLRLSTDLRLVAKKVEGSGCKLRDYDAAKMDADQVRLAQLYASAYCQTWQKFWDKALGPCDHDRPPDWCDDEAAMSQRVDLQGYFTTLASGLDAAPSSLERENIMDIVTSTLSAHVITEFPSDATESWATATVVAYLKRASPEQAIELAKALKVTWVGLAPAVLGAFDAYLNRAVSLSEDQRDGLRRALTNEVQK